MTAPLDPSQFGEPVRPPGVYPSMSQCSKCQQPVYVRPDQPVGVVLCQMCRCISGQCSE